MRNVVSCLALLIIGCGDADFSSPQAAATGPKRVIWPKVDIAPEEDSSITSWGEQTEPIAAGEPTSHLIWLNFEGATVSAEDSFIVSQADLPSTTRPAFAMAEIGAKDISAQARAAFIKTVVDSISEAFAAINVEIVTEKPETPCTAVHIGGENFTKREDIAGISPFDPGNFKDTDINFVFPPAVKLVAEEQKATILAIATSHEIGHSLGARHIDNDKAIMRPKIKETTDQFNEFGKYPDAEGEENSMDVLVGNLGPSKENKGSSKPPVLGLLDVHSYENIAQYSVVSSDNLKDNPDSDFTAYRYRWDFEGDSVEGQVVRVKFGDEDIHEVTVTVLDEDDSEKGSYTYEIGRGEASE
jgi:hypothetical protein